MSDPRNVAHAKKVAEEKKHHGDEVKQEDGHAVQPGKKPAAAKKKREPAGEPAVAEEAASHDDAVKIENTAATPPAALEGSLAVLARLKEMESHSRANLERLAQLSMTVEDELKQQELVAPLGEVYSAQNAFQTRLTALIEAYRAECDRLQGQNT